MPINSPSILVVGGAGFIGSHMVLTLRAAGFPVVVLDNLSKGHRHAVLDAELIVGDMADKKLLSSLFAERKFSAVMHFAAFIEVSESVKFPGKYYHNNVAATLNLLEVMQVHAVKYLVFSSTAAVYGEPRYMPIDEAHPLQPINPYGRSKKMVEEIIQDYAVSDHLHYAILRYFNAAGADPDGRIGECHEPESHLIPLVLQTAMKKNKTIALYGNDYPTKDGSCVRDYVHVMDLCSAHLLALQQLLSGSASMICNLGTGQGYSVCDVIDAASDVTQCEIPVVVEKRRQGDPAILVADPTLAKKTLHWQPQFSDLKMIIKHAWHYLKNSQS